jgi:hypothetical protein
MTKQRQEKKQPEKKNGHKSTAAVIEPLRELAGNTQLLEGLFGADNNVEMQTLRINGGRFQTSQQQRLAVQIGQAQGNHHLQRVLNAEKPKSIQPVDRSSLPIDWVIPQYLSTNTIQRNGPTAAQQTQWETDWNDPALKKYQNTFKGSDRPAGTAKQRYDVLCPLYFGQGIDRPLVYVRDHIVTAHLFQFTTPAHNDLESALKKAEDALKKKGYTELPATSAWAFNPRTTSEGNWSNHADGKAIDIDPDQNPRLTNAHNRDVISALTGVDMKAANLGYDTLKGASDTFKSRFNPAGLKTRVDDLQTKIDDLKKKKTELETNLQAIPTGKKATADDRTARSDLQKKFKENKKETTAVQKDHDLLNAELAAYEKLDTDLSTTETQISALKLMIDLIRAQITTASGTELKRLQSLLKKDEAQLAKTEKKKAKLEKQKNENTLRNYAQDGFVNLKKDVVEAMESAGLFWGGNWGSPNSKDFMHFQVK